MASSFVCAAWARIRCLLTKAPPSKAGIRSATRSKWCLPDAFKVEQIFNELGYHPIFRYEKFRTEYAKAPGAGKVLVDETPIGNYLEIEGSPRWIDSTARAARLFDRGLHHPQLRLSLPGLLPGAHGCPPAICCFRPKEMKQLRKNKANA